ncbi:MAG: hypothetical protein J7L89_06475, partial [Bacteroidales bacterium]|nr:hypothetical protein [Bacteroidales bacterium]
SSTSSTSSPSSTPSTSSPLPKSRRLLNILFTVLIIILAGALAYLLITLSRERKATEEMRVTLEMQKDRLTRQLDELYSAYDSLQTENDSMNMLVEQEKQKIKDLLHIKASNARKIRVYQAEVVSLQKVLKSYIVQVDSLNQANLRLQAENRDVHNRIRRATDINRKLAEQNKKQKSKIEKASVLKALAIIAEPIDNKGIVQKKIRKVDKIRVCFTLSENSLAKPGPRQIYLRIARPDERVMIRSAATNVFEFNGSKIPYSAMREVEYEGVALKVCIFYDSTPEEIIPGTYYVDLYMEGERIGTTSFSLK